MQTDRRTTRRALALTLAALLALPAAAAAQQGQHRHGGEREAPPRGMMMGAQDHGGMMGMMGMMEGMMVAGPGPGMILAQSDALELTDEQVEELEALRDRLSETRTEHMETMRTLHQRLAEQAGTPETDLEAYESAIRSLADEHVAMHMVMARAARDAREVLTTEQREKLRVGMRMMRGMMMRMMHGQGGMMEGRGGAGPDGDMGPGGGMASMMGRMRCPTMRMDRSGSS